MNYNQRKDHRSDEEFAKHISDSTKKELYLAHRWQLEMQFRGKFMAILPYGLDVTGTVNKQVQDGKPDFKWLMRDAGGLKLTEGETTLNLEVQNSPDLNKVTFKVHAIKNIIKLQA